MVRLRIADAAALVVSTALSSGLHRSYAFRAGRGGTGVRAQAVGMTVMAASILLTSAALGVLQTIDLDPSAFTVMSTLASASEMTAVLPA